MKDNIEIQELLAQKDIQTIKAYLPTATDNQKALLFSVLLRMLFNSVDRPNSSLDTRQKIYCNLCTGLKQFFSLNLPSRIPRL